MAYHFNDNVHTKSFTPREYQVELLDSARDQNIIVCLATVSAKIFIASKLIMEMARDVRKREKFTLYVAEPPAAMHMAAYLHHLTDLTVGHLTDWDPTKFSQLLQDEQVLVITPHVCASALDGGFFSLSGSNLLVIDQCQCVTDPNSPLCTLMKHYGSLEGYRPKILGLTPPLLRSGCCPSLLEWQLVQLENALYSSAETASDIVSVLRYCTRPTERVLECGIHDPCNLDQELEEQVKDALTFLHDHRYDPFEIYDEEFLEDLQGIPDPKDDPLKILNDFLNILRTLGPYCADRAALIFLVQIEKLKIKTPYERHFLLLCMVSSVMIKIRAICDYAFQQLDERDKIYKYCSPKVLRLLEVLKQFKPDKTETEEPDSQQLQQPAIEEAQNPSNSMSGQTTALNSEEQLPEQIQLESVANIISKPSTAIEDQKLENSVKQNLEIEQKAKLVPKDTTVANKTVTSRSNAGELEGKGSNRSGRGRGRGRGGRYPRKGQSDGVRKAAHDQMDPDSLCGIVFVQSHLTAKILFYLLNEVRRYDEDLSFLGVQYTVERMADPITEPRDAEQEHRKQEEVLKRFRMHECNLLIATSVLEEGMDVPRCNLVVRFDEPSSYKSYVQCKGRARAVDAYYVMIVQSDLAQTFTRRLAEFMEIERVLLHKCANSESQDEKEEQEADLYNTFVEPYCPSVHPGSSVIDNGTSTLSSTCATLSNAISIVNRYCAKLPSDTFTKLTPLWTMNHVTEADGTLLYQCTLRLPINSPVKQTIKGPLVPNQTLARRLTALKTVKVLHKSFELDDNLLPIGKESFCLANEESGCGGLALAPEEIEEVAAAWDSNEPRPGTTKRRQYYYKRIAEALTDCRPVAGSEALLYNINMILTCPLPEEQNTRGRRIYAPEESSLGFGILTLKPIPKICSFPIFTRSGEVSVGLELSSKAVELTEAHMEKIVAFLNYTFTNVLRLQKYLMMFDPHAAENSYFIVPTRKSTKTSKAEVDWEFLDRIYDKRNLSPKPVSEEIRQHFLFESAKYQDAVVMPWYRNQDQPQYFYVAEICYQLSPKSSFPSSEDYKSFEDYYFKKYGLTIQNREQPLLDVDHTSARLNFLTPRYVNRKGVALPTSSEETKRAKRENLEQKQILVPELCTVHPFPASLWRKAVCLPCILYRINALLLADQIRCQVAADIGLGCTELPQDFDWEPLNFGWSLADVLKKSKESKTKEDTSKDKDTDTENSQELPLKISTAESSREKETKTEKEEPPSKTEDEKKPVDSPWIDIGTWSNEMAINSQAEQDYDDFDPSAALPGNVTMVPNLPDMGSSGWGSSASGSGWGSPIPLQEDDESKTLHRGTVGVRYGSPTSWLTQQPAAIFRPEPCAIADSDVSYSDLSEDDDSNFDNAGNGGLRIEYKPDNTAEAVEDDSREGYARSLVLQDPEDQPWEWHKNAIVSPDSDIVKQFEENIEKNVKQILSDGRVVLSDKPFVVEKHNAEQLKNSSSCDIDQTKLRALEYIKKSNNVTDPLNGNVEINSVENPARMSSLATEHFAFDCDLELKFSFDAQPNLDGHVGPSPAVILQALTMSNANDGINLERLETIGDSFLKYAITTYLYCTYDRIHEGKLSHLRSKQVSNLNLYRLGRRKMFGESMIATKFEPHDNWLPPCYYVPRDLENALIQAGLPACHWNTADLPSLRNLSCEEIQQRVYERKETLKLANINAESDSDDDDLPLSAALQHKKLIQLQQQQQIELLQRQKEEEEKRQKDNGNNSIMADESANTEGNVRGEGSPEKSELNIVALHDPIALLTSMPCFIPYNLITQHSIPDKSIADCVEALIGAYLISCGPRGALLFMAWLGIQVLPRGEKADGDGKTKIYYGTLEPPRSPLLRYVPNPEGELEILLDGFEKFETQIKYRFRDRSYLLQALTHASYSTNHLTDCYQRLEFLGDAVLDYLITRHLYEDWRQHSPGALTDLRSALVNNTIFASLAVKFGFHKYFRHLSPGLSEVVDRFVRIQEENGHAISEEYYLIEEEECEEAEDVEVPKALGDVFESVAGAIFLDSKMSLDAVWRVYYRMMRSEIEQFSANVPKSPIRELLEMEPETAKFGKPEKLADGRRVRVTVEVFSKGTFKGIGRNYRIAKCTAAKCALKQLKKRECRNK